MRKIKLTILCLLLFFIRGISYILAGQTYYQETLNPPRVLLISGPYSWSFMVKQDVCRMVTFQHWC